MGLTACRAAYESGLPWLQEVRNYIRGNMDFTASYLAENIPEVRLIHPEGTYLLWLDMRGLGLGDEELERFITQDAGLWLDRGSMFGRRARDFSGSTPPARVRLWNRLSDSCTKRFYRSADKHSGADFLSVRNRLCCASDAPARNHTS